MRLVTDVVNAVEAMEIWFQYHPDVDFVPRKPYVTFRSFSPRHTIDTSDDANGGSDGYMQLRMSDTGLYHEVSFHYQCYKTVPRNAPRQPFIVTRSYRLCVTSIDEHSPTLNETPAKISHTHSSNDSAEAQAKRRQATFENSPDGAASYVPGQRTNASPSQAHYEAAMGDKISDFDERFNSHS
ncbi:hypothetical protein CcaCcLH18_14191 [Colletotrichum camelliae]|nr:hypothetical protein CcaCcLH18_14191 [Colletotrichum camelliae]